MLHVDMSVWHVCVVFCFVGMVPACYMFDIVSVCCMLHGLDGTCYMVQMVFACCMLLCIYGTRLTVLWFG